MKTVFAGKVETKYAGAAVAPVNIDSGEVCDSYRAPGLLPFWFLFVFQCRNKKVNVFNVGVLCTFSTFTFEKENSLSLMSVQILKGKFHFSGALVRSRRSFGLQRGFLLS